MITTFFINLASLVLGAISGFFVFLTLTLHIPIDQWTSAIDFFINGIWYFQGLFPVQSMMNLILFVISVEFVFLVIGFFEWVYHKIPFLGH